MDEATNKCHYSEHQIAIVSFDGAIKREVRRIKEKLKQVESLSRFSIEIEVDGSLHDTGFTVKYKVSDGRFGGVAVEGNNLEACAEELLHRFGWDRAHQPKEITDQSVPI